MKKIILTLSLIMLILNSFSQGFLRDSKKSINVSSELGNYGIYLFPNFMLDFKKNTIAFGPTFNIYPSYNFLEKVDNVFYPTKNKFYGSHLYYQYNFRPDKIFNFFIQTNLSFEYIALMNYIEPSNNLENGYESKRMNLSQTFGGGCKINFSEKIFANMSIDMGFYYFENLRENEGYSIQVESQPNSTGIIRIGFGYRL